MPLIKNRISSFLNEIQYNKEFSVTIVKNYVRKYIIYVNILYWYYRKKKRNKKS